MPTGLSIHIGLNKVDPEKYDGWDGELNACENDARDMAELAKSLDYRGRTMLLTPDATAQNVTAALKKAAGELKSGDILFLTYSGHGGQVPDLNGNEKDRQDETWVLFDRQLVDDELYELYGAFEDGVRIVVLSDSCHSGSVAEQVTGMLAPEELESAFGTREPKEAEKKIKALPLYLNNKLYKRDRTLYDRIQHELPAKDAREIGASILLISGCQDDQTCMDGPVNGAFTGALLSVWAGGTGFSGDYQALHRRIKEELRGEYLQSPNLFLAGRPDPEFVEQRPFAI
ncbi:caspase family protein [Streptomyces syringium]|uniref:caspase family protein n=1 Tax=Streptomyces syringium TaxID=76729 RepID=UPI003655B16B